MAGRRADGAAMGVVAGRLLRRQPRLRPPRRLQNGNDGQPQRGRLRRGLPAAEPGPDARRSTVPGADAYTTNLLRPFRGLGNINQNTTEFWDTYHSIQTASTAGSERVLLRRQLHAGPVAQGQHRPAAAAAARADGTISIRADQAEYEKLNEKLNLQRHFLKANAVWDMPDVSTAGGGGRRSSATISTTGSSPACFTGQLRRPLQPGLQLPEQRRATVNLTGSPDYGARIIYIGDPGAGCSDNQYGQFNSASVTGPTYGSVGLESGRNITDRLPDKRTRPLPCAHHPPGRRAVSSSSASTRSTRSTARHQRGAAPRSTTTARPTRHPQLAVPRRTARSTRTG